MSEMRNTRAFGFLSSSKKNKRVRSAKRCTNKYYLKEKPLQDVEVTSVTPSSSPELVKALSGLNEYLSVLHPDDRKKYSYYHSFWKDHVKFVSHAVKEISILNHTIADRLIAMGVNLVVWPDAITGNPILERKWTHTNSFTMQPTGRVLSGSIRRILESNLYPDLSLSNRDKRVNDDIFLIKELVTGLILPLDLTESTPNPKKKERVERPKGPIKRASYFQSYRFERRFMKLLYNYSCMALNHETNRTNRYIYYFVIPRLVRRLKFPFDQEILSYLERDFYNSMLSHRMTTGHPGLPKRLPLWCITTKPQQKL